jgi:hypothetical protein
LSESKTVALKDIVGTVKERCQKKKRRKRLKLKFLLCSEEEEKGPKRLRTGIFILGDD